MNNLVADNNKDANTARKRRREKADINYHNYYIKISKFNSNHSYNSNFWFTL